MVFITIVYTFKDRLSRASIQALVYANTDNTLETSTSKIATAPREMKVKIEKPQLG